MARLSLTRNPFKLIQAVGTLGVTRPSGLEPQPKRIALVGRHLGAGDDIFFDLFGDIGVPGLAGDDHAVGADYLQGFVSEHERVCGRRR